MSRPRHGTTTEPETMPETMPETALTPIPAALPTVGGFVRFTNLHEAMEFATFICKSDMVPAAFRNKPADIVIAMQMGMELGFSPLQSLQMIAVINGRPGIYGDAIPALIMGHPACEDFVEVEPTGSDEKQWVAQCTITRRHRTPIVRRFAYEDAKRAGLIGKAGPWTQYLKRMLMMRARGFAARDSFADLLRGVKIIEELQDIPVSPIASAYIEPRRLGDAEAEPEPVAETPAPEPPPAPAAPTVPPDDTLVNLSVLDYTYSKDARGGFYTFITNDGEFVLRDADLASKLMALKDTDHTFTATYRRATIKEGVVRVLVSATIDIPGVA